MVLWIFTEVLLLPVLCSQPIDTQLAHNALESKRVVAEGKATATGKRPATVRVRRPTADTNSRPNSHIIVYLFIKKQI